ncbi:hypothetical protein WR25_00390 [Diploscapter pachys]|uniref:Uncharacterized protein n=1 Tax=Diploscapter pachys TaxID=2018661 RepID=A0A2A2JYP1_9BILA|nr:hypothetical protein WR25_00390 [Diploscapter pachys]
MQFQHHPISRRVLRFERSTDKGIEKFEGDDVSQDMPMPADFFQPILDFAKPQPELPIKVKPSHIDPDLDYQPDLEFK